MPSFRRRRWQEIITISSIQPINVDTTTDTTTCLDQFALTMNMTIEQVLHIRKEYEIAIEQLQHDLRNPNLSGTIKHNLHCQHRVKYGRQPFVCHRCWSYIPICICHEIDQEALLNPFLLCINHHIECAVIFWTHHKEWGSTSNTGSVVSALLCEMKNSCSMLMKGYDPHDAQLGTFLCNKNNTASSTTTSSVVLWTENETEDGIPREFIGIKELRDELFSRDINPVDGDYVQKQILYIVVVEGTWGQARRMVSKLPSSVRGLSLTHDQIFGWRQQQQQQQSLLNPLRKAKTTNKCNSHPVCSADAVIGALLAFSAITVHQAESVLSFVEQKVRNTAVYQGKVNRVASSNLITASAH